MASSWRNMFQPAVIVALKSAGVECYDFRNPAPGQGGFAWSEIDPAWEQWTPWQWRDALKHPLAVDWFKRDMDALRACTACLMVLPCGRSAHLELGWAVGARKATAVLAMEPTEPDLMVAMCSELFTDFSFAIEWCAKMCGKVL